MRKNLRQALALCQGHRKNDYIKIDFMYASRAFLYGNLNMYGSAFLYLKFVLAKMLWNWLKGDLKGYLWK